MQMSSNALQCCLSRMFTRFWSKTNSNQFNNMVRSGLFQTSSNLFEPLPNQFALFLSFQLTKETSDWNSYSTLKVYSRSSANPNDYYARTEVYGGFASFLCWKIIVRDLGWRFVVAMCQCMCVMDCQYDFIMSVCDCHLDSSQQMMMSYESSVRPIRWHVYLWMGFITDSTYNGAVRVFADLAANMSVCVCAWICLCWRWNCVVWILWFTSQSV